MGANDTGVIGKAVRRKEDLRFLTGAGQYTDDVTFPRQTYACFVRSPHAHANLRKIDTTKAKAAPGVVAVFTGADMTGVNGLPCGWLITGMDGKPMNEPPHPVLAQGKVRYVGRPGRAGDRRVRRAGEGCGRTGRHRLRGAAGGRQLRRCAEARRAADPRRGAGQQVLHVGVGRQGGDGRGVREGRARDEARHRQQPAHSERDRAARGGRGVQPRRRPVHAVRVEPESARRAAADDGVRARHPGDEGARDRARRRRRLRLEDLPVRRGNGDGVGVEAREPPDQVGGRPQRGVPHRRARARPRHARRTRAGQGRQVPRDARD